MAGAACTRREAAAPGGWTFATLMLLPRLVRALGKGDDGALRELIALFEENGMAVRGAPMKSCPNWCPRRAF